MIKRIFVSVMCIVLAFPLVGCDLFKDPEFKYDRVLVGVVAEGQREYVEENYDFLEDPNIIYRLFTIEDFEWDNIDFIWVTRWGYNESNVHLSYVVHLKEAGRSKVLNAIDHFETLDFVTSANTINIDNVIY